MPAQSSYSDWIKQAIAQSLAADKAIGGRLWGDVQPLFDALNAAAAFPNQRIDEAIRPGMNRAFGGTGAGDIMTDAIVRALGPFMTGMPAEAPAPIRMPTDLRETAPNLPPRSYTQPLPELTAAGERYHGTRYPIRDVWPSEQGSKPANLWGQGFYTTDNKAVAGGYAGMRGPIYSVYEVKPAKLFDVEEDMPPKVQAAVSRYVKSKFPYGNLEGVYDPEKMSLQEVVNRLGIDPNELIPALKQQGYRGFTHTGGKITGGALHQVKIYWYPQEDIRIRSVEDFPQPAPGVGYGARQERQMWRYYR